MALEPVTVRYRDVTGAVRRVRVQARVPSGATSPAPVVVWSHGGTEGRRAPVRLAQEWSDALVGAGYAVVVIAHPSRGPAEERALCAALGPATCATYPSLGWDRAHDVSAVLDRLEAEAAPGGSLAGQIDPSLVVHVGHSAGGAAALLLVGARREIAGEVRDLSDPRVVAAVSSSGPGVGPHLDQGFDDTSFATVDRPHLLLTGVGDTTEGTSGADRRRVADAVPASHAHLAWFTDDTAAHGTFDLDTSACRRRGGTPEVCDRHTTVITSVVAAFLDAHVRDDPAARAWLASDAASRLGRGTVELTVP
ncbi:MAG TPA: hypothetical protein VK866_16860 [Acidimicrobiales bacterium]|nr:hypothetical protein [Acidimicrobiales bacterium]